MDIKQKNSVLVIVLALIVGLGLGYLMHQKTPVSKQGASAVVGQDGTVGNIVLETDPLATLPDIAKKENAITYDIPGDVLQKLVKESDSFNQVTDSNPAGFTESEQQQISTTLKAALPENIANIILGSGPNGGTGSDYWVYACNTRYYVLGLFSINWGSTVTIYYAQAYHGQNWTGHWFDCSLVASLY